MKRAFAIASTLILLGCSGGASAPPADNKVATGPSAPAPTPPTPPPPSPAGPCVGPLAPGAEANCDFGAPEQMTGVWVTGFETSAFLPGATAAPDRDDPGINRLWLDFAEGSYPDPALRASLDALHGTAAVAIIFMGRRSRAPGSEVVIVDRIISARSLGLVQRR
jgi:hypothetical protein